MKEVRNEVCAMVRTMHQYVLTNSSRGRPASQPHELLVLQQPTWTRDTSLSN